MPGLLIEKIDLIRHYPMLKSWWEERQFPPADPEFLPPTGLLIWDAEGEVGVCAGFLFKTDANTAIIGNIVSNPKTLGRDLRNQALDTLIDHLMALAKSEGFGVVTCGTNLPKLQARYLEKGFIKTDSGIDHFGRVLACQ